MLDGDEDGDEDGAMAGEEGVTSISLEAEEV